MFTQTIRSNRVLFAFLVVSMVALMASNAYGQGTQQCTLRSALTAAEIDQLIPGNSFTTMNAGDVLAPVAGAGVTYITSAYGLLCTLGVIKQIADLLFLLVTILAVAAIVYSAFLFLTSAGDPTKTGAAKNWLLYAIVGLVIAVIARIIPAVAITLLGIG